MKQRFSAACSRSRFNTISKFIDFTSQPNPAKRIPSLLDSSGNAILINGLLSNHPFVTTAEPLVLPATGCFQTIAISFVVVHLHLPTQHGFRSLQKLICPPRNIYEK
jgi:hypothetical protein